MEYIVIIADDLTGAADSAVQFCPYFDDTMLVSYQKWDRTLDPTVPASTRATAIYTNSRALGVDQARNRLVSLAQGLGALEGLRIYKKIDSCMRGNVGAETDELLDQLGYAASFITPAFPEMGDYRWRCTLGPWRWHHQRCGHVGGRSQRRRRR